MKEVKPSFQEETQESALRSVRSPEVRQVKLSWLQVGLT